MNKIVPITKDNLKLFAEGAKKFGMERSLAWYERILFDPTVGDLTQDACRGHMSVSESGDVVAVQAYYYQPCYFKQQRILGNTGCIMGADHAFGEELLCVLDANKESKACGWLSFGNCISSARSAKISVKANRMKEPPYRVRTFRVGAADVVAYFVGVTRKIFRRSPDAMQKVFWFLTRPIQLVWQFPRKRMMHASGCRFSRKMSFEEGAFEPFWQRFLAANDGVISSREPKRLAWLFNDALKSERDILVVAEKDGQIDGYVLLREENYSGWLKSYEIMDVCAVGNNIACLKGLVAAAGCFASRARGMSLHFFGYMPNQEQWLDPVLKIQRKTEWSSFFYKSRDPEIAESLAQNKGWFFGPFDGERCMGHCGYNDD